MKITVGAKTDPGRRPNNEDQLLVVDVRRHSLRADSVLVIADGMGGRNFGERAAAAAVETIGDTLVEMLSADRDPSVDINEALYSALRKANACVYELAGSDEASQGMGTTCVAVVLENDRLHVAHAGDSRAYLLRAGQLQRLTDDHSYVAEQVRAGNLSEEGARKSRFRNVITRAVGIEPTITPDVTEYDIIAGDALLLCTDGLTNMVGEDEIAHVLAQHSSAQAAADKLVMLANRNGGRDNITAIVARMELGNRTQRMRADDLAQIVGGPKKPQTVDEPAPAPVEYRNGAVADDDMVVDDPPTARMERALPEPQPAPRPQATVYEDRKESVRRAAPRRKAPVGVILLTLLCLALAGCGAYLIQLMAADGFRFQINPPFAYKPAPPRPPKPIDLSRLTYGAPALLSVTPVQGALLTRCPTDRSVVVLTLSGQVVHFTADGQTVYKYPLPDQYRPTPLVAEVNAAPPPDSMPVPRLHWTTDAQGNLYIADSVGKTLMKYRANGEFIRSIAAGKLQAPAALTIGDDGTIYLVDAQRLKIIRPAPASR